MFIFQVVAHFYLKGVRDTLALEAYEVTNFSFWAKEKILGVGSEWECTRWTLFCRRITNPEIGALLTFLTLKRKMLYFSWWQCEQDKHFFSFFFFFKETLLITGRGLQNIGSRKNVRKSENYVHATGHHEQDLSTYKQNTNQKQRDNTIWCDTIHYNTIHKMKCSIYLYLKLWCSSRFGDEETPWFIVPIIYGLENKIKHVNVLKVKEISMLKLPWEKF